MKLMFGTPRCYPEYAKKTALWKSGAVTKCKNLIHADLLQMMSAFTWKPEYSYGRLNCSMVHFGNIQLQWVPNRPVLSCGGALILMPPT